MTRALFRIDAEVREYAVVIVRTGVAFFTSPDLDLAKRHLGEIAHLHGELEVREVVTTVASRRAFRPGPAQAVSPAPAGRDPAIPAHA